MATILLSDPRTTTARLSLTSSKDVPFKVTVVLSILLIVYVFML